MLWLLELSWTKFTWIYNVRQGVHLEISGWSSGMDKWTNLSFPSILLVNIGCRIGKRIRCFLQQLQRIYSNQAGRYDKKTALMQRLKKLLQIMLSVEIYFALRTSAMKCPSGYINIFGGFWCKFWKPILEMLSSAL